MVSEFKSLIWENVFNQPLSRRFLSFFFFFRSKKMDLYIEVCSLYALMSVERIQPGEISNFLDWNTLEDVLNRSVDFVKANL